MFCFINKLKYYDRNWDIHLLQNKHIVELALPFIALYKPAGTSLSYGSCLYSIGFRTFHLISVRPSSQRECAEEVKEIVKNILELGATHFQLGFGLFIHTAFNLIEDIYTLTQAKWDQKSAKIVPLLFHALYLLAISPLGSLEIVIASLLLQACIQFYQMVCAGEEIPSKKIKILDFLAKGSMGLIRLYQAHGYYKEIKKMQDIVQQIEAFTPTCEVASPLQNLPQQIEAKRFILKDATGKTYDFGSYFHGFGRGIVKGANLNFKVKDGMCELTFTINTLFRERLKEIMWGLASLPPEIRKEIAGGDLSFESAVFEIGPNLHFDTATKIKLGELGYLKIGPEDYYNLRDRIQVYVQEGSDLLTYQKVLSAVGLNDVLEPSTLDDFKRMQIGYLFRLFYPKVAYSLEQDKKFFDLPTDRLQQEIIQRQPEMKHVFQKNIAEAKEILPGNIRYTFSIDKLAYDEGLRGLTAGITGTRFYDSDIQDLDLLASILQNGLFSLELRQMSGIQTIGLSGFLHYKYGGAKSVFTQMITKDDIQRQKKISEFGYESAVRLYFSLKPLNRGTYQYNDDSGGFRNSIEYAQRKNIIKFLKQKKYETYHEVMIPDRILPEEIKAMSVSSKALKDRIILHFEKLGLIKEGKIGGVPVDEFILTDHHLTESLATRLS